MSRRTNKEAERDRDIVEILEQKQTRRGIAYLVRLKGENSQRWVNQQIIPTSVMEKYNKATEKAEVASTTKQKSQKRVTNKKYSSRLSSSSQQEAVQFKESIKGAEVEQEKKQKRGEASMMQEEEESEQEQMPMPIQRQKQNKMEANKASKKDDFFNESAEQQKDNFFNQSNKSESNSQNGGRIVIQSAMKPKKNQQKQKVCEVIDFNSITNMELVAEVSDDSQEEESDEQMMRMKGKTKNKRKAKPKGKSKMQISSMKSRNTHLNQDNIMSRRNRQQEKKNYNLDSNIKQPKYVKPAINYEGFLKNYQRAQDLEELLISTVKSSGMVGPYKFYQVRLRNAMRVFIREKDMLRYFPRKLHQFYQRTLNKVASSTEKLLFTL